MRIPSFMKQMFAVLADIDAGDVIGGVMLFVIMGAGLWIGFGLGMSPDSEAMTTIINLHEVKK